MGDQQVQHERLIMAAGALAAQTAITFSLNLAATRTSGVIIKKWMASFQDKDFTLGEGPVLFGISQDLSAAEVAEALTADPSGTGDIPETEQANRRVFPLGMISVLGPTEINFVREIHWPWKELKENTGLQMWLFNLDTATLITGGNLVGFHTWVQEWFD